MSRILFSAAGLALAAQMAPPVAVQAANIEIEAEGPVIELNMVESIVAEPDLVTIGAGVTTNADTAVEALRLNSAEMRRVIAAIKAQGIDEQNIKTTGISLNAQYDFNQTTKEREFKGYSVSNRVTVILRDIPQTGAFLDALILAGANNISGPSFDIEDRDKGKDAARKRALQRAQAQAADYADLMGYDKAKILEINETISAPRARRSRAGALRGEGFSSAATAPVQPGMVSTSVAITVKFELLNDADDGAQEE